MPLRKKIAVILSGCGVYDGSEIHEAVFTLWAIEKAGAEYHIFAPDIDQRHVINHLSGEIVNESRNVLTESARIARGHITPLDLLNPTLYDALMLPGGYGAAKNLCSFAFEGSDCSVNDDVQKAIVGFHKHHKPIGALCISPVILAAVLHKGLLTIGNDVQTADLLKKMGSSHSDTTHGEIIIDKENKLVTSPCYMLDASISQVAAGAENTVNALLTLIN